MWPIDSHQRFLETHFFSPKTVLALLLSLASCSSLFAYLSWSNSAYLVRQLGHHKTGWQPTVRAQLYGGVPSRGLVAVPSRDRIAEILQEEGLKAGAELGVQWGVFAEHTLRTWSACERFYLVDIWRKQENYEDGANVDNDEQEQRYQHTRRLLEPYEGKTVFLRMFTTEAAAHIPDASLDYVYVDARHDYCGVREDLEAYWGKLRSGGILAGHDYLDEAEVRLRLPHEDWGLCQDGSRNSGAVKGAVNEFALAHGLQLMVTYNETAWPTWMARKP